MSYTYIFEPRALNEYKEAVIWYRERSEIAARNLTKELKSGLEAICDNPLLYRNTYKIFREISLKKYPYCIVYFVDERTKTVIITSLYHHKRNPKKKYRK